MAEKTLVYRINFDGLEAQAAAIGKVDGELTALNQTIKDQRSGIKQLQELNQQGTQAYADLSAELGKNITQQRATSKAKSDLIRETQNEAKVLKENEGSIVSLRAQLSLLTKEYNNLTKAERENTKGNDLQIKARAISDELKKLEGAIGNNTRNVGNYTGSLKEAGNALLGSFGISFGIGAAVTGLVALGKQLAETSKEVKAIQTTLKQTSNITGEALEDATIKVQLLSGAIGEDFNSVLTASNALSKQFGITTTEALNLIQDGFVRGANSNGEFLQSLKEYPAQFKSIGISAQESIDIITATANQGIYSDKGIDTIKEAGLALREQTKATQDALRNAFGAQFTDELLGNINNGSITLFQAIQSISGELGKLEPQSKEVGAVIADVFKGAGEDAGLAYLTSLKDIGNETKIVSEATKQLIEEQEKQLRLAEAQIRVTTVLSDGFNSLKSSLISYADEALTVVEQGNGFEKYLALLTFGFSATEGRAKELRDELAAVKAAQDALFSEINTTDVLTIEKRLADLSKVVASGNDQFGFAAQAIEFYNKRLTELDGTAVETTKDLDKLSKEQEKANQKLLDDLKKAQELLLKLQQENDLALVESVFERERIIADIEFEANKKSVQGLNVTNDVKLQLLAEYEEKYLRTLNTITAREEQSINDTANQRIASIKRLEEQGIGGTGEGARAQDPRDADEAERQQRLKDERIAEIQERADAAATTLEIASNTINTLAQLKDMETEQNIARINRERDAQLKQIQDSTLSEEQKALKIAEINKKAEERANAERKKNAESQKRFALVQIALDTAKGIAAAVAAGAGLVFPANLPAIASGIAAVLAGIVNATAAVNSAKFALGGEIPKGGGFITGNSHAQGGVKFSAGGRLMEAEGGEIIVNKGIQKRPDFVRAISQMNYMTGGKKFETGGIVAPVFSAAGASLASQEQNVGQGFSFEIPPIQVLNNVVDTTSQQSSIIQIQNQTSIGG
jgi:hypothetical protein